MNTDFAIGISFDVEATGCRPTRHAMIEVGAVALNMDTGETLSRFSVEIQMPPGRSWEQRCLEQFWDNKDWKKLDKSDPERSKKKETYLRLQKKRQRVAEGRGETPKDAMLAFIKWAKERVLGGLAGGDHKRIIFYSDTVSFDSTFMNVYLDEFADHEPLHLFFGGFNDVVCTSNVAQGLSVVTPTESVGIKRKLGWYDRDEECRERLMIPKDMIPNAGHNHDAVSDAEFIGQEFSIQVGWAEKIRKRIRWYDQIEECARNAKKEANPEANKPGEINKRPRISKC